MALVMNPQPAGYSDPVSLKPSVMDEDPLSMLSQQVRDGVEALNSALCDDFQSKTVPSVVKELPSRRSHQYRPQVHVIAQLLFPDFSAEKALIHYEVSRRKACQIVRANEAADKAMKQALRGGFKAMEVQGPWAGQEADPVSLAGPPALPMPVQIGKAEHFKDCFNFLASNQDPNDFCPGTSSGKRNAYGLTPGKELIWNTPMVEFDRGVVYVDRRLDLCKMVVGPTHITPLMDALRSNTFVRHFLLGNNIISATGARAIAAFIRDRPDHMETWYLAGNHIKPQGFAQLASAMTASASITNVWLKRNPLGPGSIPDLAALILQTPHLRTLDLENTELGDAGVARLFALLTGRPLALQNVYLNANGIGANGATAVAACLAAGWAPASLLLAANPLGDAGAAPLARALRANRSLVRLGLQSTGLTSAGVAAVCAALAPHPRLAALVLAPPPTTAVHGQRYNHVADAALPALAKLVTRSSTLRVLELGRTALSADAVEALRDALAASPGLCHFAAWHALAAPGSCALRVRQRLASNVRRLYGTGLDEFRQGLGLRLLRNTPDVRLIDSVYRTRDKRKGAAGAKQFWDEGDRVWAMVDGEWDEAASE